MRAMVSDTTGSLYYVETPRWGVSTGSGGCCDGSEGHGGTYGLRRGEAVTKFSAVGSTLPCDMLAASRRYGLWKGTSTSSSSNLEAAIDDTLPTYS